MQIRHPLLQPDTLLRLLEQRNLQRRARTLCEQSAQVRISTSGNVTHPLFSAGAVLSGNQTHPGCHLPAVFEVLCVGNRGHYSARREGSYAADGTDALGILALFGVLDDLLLAGLDPLFKRKRSAKHVLPSLI